jgi:hypothetical protein
MNGRRGEFYNVTWLAYLGALAALASGRFAAAISQARLRRRISIRDCGRSILDAVAPFAGEGGGADRHRWLFAVALQLQSPKGNPGQ